MGPISIPHGWHHNGLGCQGASATVGGTLHRTNEECGIREVWAHNMEEEFRAICQVSTTRKQVSGGDSNICRHFKLL